MSTPEAISTPAKLAMLWLHETYRVYVRDQLCQLERVRAVPLPPGYPMITSECEERDVNFCCASIHRANNICFGADVFNTRRYSDCLVDEADVQTCRLLLAQVVKRRFPQFALSTYVVRCVGGFLHFMECVCAAYFVQPT